MGYLLSGNKAECFGCEACKQICPTNAIEMKEDEEGFRYPFINKQMCIKCGLCDKTCPKFPDVNTFQFEKYVFGGYHVDAKKRYESTSGGAFSAIVDEFCDDDYVVFGAESRGLSICHGYTANKEEIGRFRKSKYSQSVIGETYLQVKQFLLEGKKVLFSGTPCQISALKSCLGKVAQEKLLTVEVVCEGVPSPLYVRKYEKYLNERFGKSIQSLDYRYKGKSIFKHGKWDFEQMKIDLLDKNGKRGKAIIKDRWVNPFWSIWLKHLMNRPSCYECPYATETRMADITLGDLWGVHLYCPELYGKNGGASLVVCNSEKGKEVFQRAEKSMYGHELFYEDAVKYQTPMRKHIDKNPQREFFMNDLQNDAISYRKLNKKWATPPTVKLLWNKYIYGNRQKIWIWNLLHRKKGLRKDEK